MNKNHLFRKFLYIKASENQILRIVKITYFLLFFSFFCLSAANVNSQNAEITLDKQNVRLSNVLAEIEKQTDYLFVYDKSVDVQRTVSINVNHKNLRETLQQLFTGTNISFTTEGSNIVLKTTNNQSFQQNEKKKISGNIQDTDGEPVTGATVAVKGTTIGTISDIDGLFSLIVPEDTRSLVISYVGMKTQEILLDSKTNTYNITLANASISIDEVVVTAMGIEREAKSLTYATQTIKKEELVRIKEPNFINALQGKSAGLLITPNNSGAGGGATKIVLRGQSSILGTNQPLIVLDGIPLSDGMGSQTGELLSAASRDGGDLLSTINPDDIASMTILKGPNAAALYGSSANNGVIIINTKSGERGTVKVDISSSTSVETLFMYPQTQTTYGLTPNATLEAWGPKISEMSADDLASQPYYTATPRNPVKDFFNTGLTLNNGITLSGGTELTRSYFSYNNTTQFGMVPNNKFIRHNFMFKESFALFNNKLNISTTLNYIHQETKNRPVVGRVLSPLHALYRMPSNVDMRYFSNHYKHIGTREDKMVYDSANGNSKLAGQPIQTWYWYDQHLNNPYWLANMLNDEMYKDRILGNLTLKAKIWKNIDFQSRLNADVNLNSSLNTEYATAMRESQGKAGKYWTGSGKNTDIYNDNMVTFNERIDNKIDVNVAVGTSFSRQYSRDHSITTYIDTTGVPNAFVPQNSAYRRPGNPNGSATSAEDSYDYSDWSTAIFTTASVGLWNKVYFDGSYRLEWAQSFQQFTNPKEGYTSFDYYSAGVNLLLEKLLPWKMPAVNQMKLRGNWSVVGNPIPNRKFARQTIDFGTGSISARPPLYDNPVPETTTSYETGLDVWMFDNAFNFDITYYNATLENQFLTISTSSGESKPLNTGKIRNYGVEFSATYRWMISRSFRWTTGFNIAYNKNKILETYKTETGVPYVVQMGPSNFKIKYIEGGAYGDIYVNSFLKNSDGSIKVNNPGDYENAVPQMASGKYETFVGNTTAPVNLGWNNTFTWKNLNIYVLIDGKIGGKIMSLTNPDRDYYGLSEESAYDRLNGERIIQNGVEYVLKELPDGQKVSVEKYYRTVGSNPMENYVYDATNLRLRDLAIGYTFQDLLGPGRNLTTSFTVKNVCFLYKNSPIDPDISVSAANGFSGIDSYSLPTARSFGLNLKLNF